MIMIWESGQVWLAVLMPCCCLALPSRSSQFVGLMAQGYIRPMPCSIPPNSAAQRRTRAGQGAPETCAWHAADQETVIGIKTAVSVWACLLWCGLGLSRRVGIQHDIWVD